MIDKCNMLEIVARKMDIKVVEAYKSLGEFLSRYKSGALPKVFKIIPSLSNWEEILYLTSPEKMDAACYI